MHTRVSTTIAARAARVFAVLLDPYAYPRWVVGARKIRAVDQDWPADGSTFYHEVGIGPLRIRDSTTLVGKRPGSQVRLRARAWPAGEAEITFTLEQDGDTTKVTMEEEPAAGPARAFGNPLVVPALHARNLVTLWRLKQLVEAGSPPAGGE